MSGTWHLFHFDYHQDFILHSYVLCGPIRVSIGLIALYRVDSLEVGVFLLRNKAILGPFLRIFSIASSIFNRVQLKFYLTDISISNIISLYVLYLTFVWNHWVTALLFQIFQNSSTIATAKRIQVSSSSWPQSLTISLRSTSLCSPTSYAFLRCSGLPLRPFYLHFA